MRILSIGNFGTGWDGSICDEEHIAQVLENLGHEVIRSQREELNAQGWPIEVDFTLIAQWDRFTEDVSALPRPIVYWAFDHQADGQDWHDALVNTCDLYLSKRLADSKYTNWQWLSQDFAPKFLNWIEGVEQDIDVLFTGSYLPWATERIETLRAVDQRYNLVIHSVTPDQWKAEGFKNVYGPVMDDALPGLIARAKINLSIDHTIEAGYWSDRNAQIMACGGFVLFRYVPLSEIRFNNRIEYFHTIEGCLEEIDYYLKHPADRHHVAVRGHDYALEHLMVYNRVEDLLTIVGGIL